MTVTENREAIESLLRKFQPISLEEMDAVKLFDRQDTKFIFGDHLLTDLLTDLKERSRVLTINDKQLLRYENLYYDTDDLLLYRQHHNQQLSRYKVRYRKYLDSGTCYFEIKQKNNKGRTIKRRILMPDLQYPFDDVAQSMILERVGVSPEQLSPSLDTFFTRMTLVGESLRDRVTIDFDIKVRGNEEQREFLHLVIAEIKQSRYSTKSDFFQIMRKHRIQNIRFSKYCMGILYTYPDMKYNRFKPTMLKINRILSGTNHGKLVYG